MFRKTLTVILKSLGKKQFSLTPSSVQKWFHESENSTGWFGLEPSAHQEKLVELARHIYRLLVLFKKDETVCQSELYQLMQRPFDENCDKRR